MSRTLEDRQIRALTKQAKRERRYYNRRRRVLRWQLQYRFWRLRRSILKSFDRQSES